MTAILRDREERCDSCQLAGLPECPGVQAHCAMGEHCTTVTAVCSIDASRDDHSWRCCSCGQGLQAGRR